VNAYLYENRFPYRDATGKADAALLRTALSEIARAELPEETKTRVLGKAFDLLARTERGQALSELHVTQLADGDGVDLQLIGYVGERLYNSDGSIGGITSENVRAAIARAGAGPIRITLYSPGGDAFEGADIYAALKAVPNHKTIKITGVAASAASVIAMAGNTVEMAANATMMIHRASTHVGGNEDALSSALSMLRAIDTGAVQAYVARTKQEPEYVRRLLNAETWLTAQRAQELGFVDRISDAVSVQQSLLPADLPEDVARMLHASPPPAILPPMGYPKALLDRLGLAETATDVEVNAALDKALAPPAPPAPPAVPPASVEQLAAATKAAHDSAVQAAVERAISAGKLLPAQRAAAVAMCGNDAAQLTAVVAYWDGLAAVVPTQAPAAKPVPAATQVSDRAAEVVREDREHLRGTVSSRS
jgi:ATP-dependent protease ClpP protease subunit